MKSRRAGNRRFAVMDATILLVDDDQIMRRLCRVHLEGAGYHVVEAEHGREGLQKLDENGVDVVLLDLMMPERSGWEVLTEIRGEARTRKVPVVILSSRGTNDDQARGLAAGADAYVSKPFEGAKLIRAVETVLRRRPPL